MPELQTTDNPTAKDLGALVSGLEITQTALAGGDLKRVKRGFELYNDARNIPAYDKKELRVALRNSTNDLIASLDGYTVWNWLYVDTLWVDETLHKQGLGKKILAVAETEAIKRGCVGAYVWTQSWQAAGFYTKQGYEQFVVLPDFPVGHQRLGFMKRLVK
jgi:GNAT superfamily N-acetyltransferase